MDILPIAKRVAARLRASRSKRQAAIRGSSTRPHLAENVLSLTESYAALVLATFAFFCARIALAS